MPLKSERLTPERELGLAFARMTGMVLAFILLTLGGGIALIVLLALVLRFLGGG